MPDPWMPSAERHPTGNGGTMDGMGGPRATHHITWDRNASASAPADLVPFTNLVGYFSGGGAGSAPHLLADPFTGRIAQFIPANQSARALVNASGGVETNRHGTANIQIEWLFFPHCRVGGKVYATLADTPMAGLDRVMAWLRSWGVPDVWPMGSPSWSGNRNANTWNTRAGHYGHSQVPENDHTDPGPMPDLFNHQEDEMTPQDKAELLAAIREIPGGVWNHTLPNPDGNGGKAAYWFQIWPDKHTERILAAVGGVDKAVAALAQLVSTSGLSAEAVVEALAARTLEIRIRGEK